MVSLKRECAAGVFAQVIKNSDSRL